MTGTQGEPLLTGAAVLGLIALVALVVMVVAFGIPTEKLRRWGGGW